MYVVHLLFLYPKHLKTSKNTWNAPKNQLQLPLIFPHISLYITYPYLSQNGGFPPKRSPGWPRINSGALDRRACASCHWAQQKSWETWEKPVKIHETIHETMENPWNSTMNSPSMVILNGDLPFWLVNEMWKIQKICRWCCSWRNFFFFVLRIYNII